MKKTRRAQIVTTVTGTEDEILAELAEVRTGWKALGKDKLSDQAERARKAVQAGATGVTVGHIRYEVGPDLPDLENAVQTCAQIAASGQDDPLRDIAEALQAADWEHQADQERELLADRVVNKLMELGALEDLREAVPDVEEHQPGCVAQRVLTEFTQAARQAGAEVPDADHVVTRAELAEWGRIHKAYEDDDEEYEVVVLQQGEPADEPYRDAYAEEERAAARLADEGLPVPLMVDELPAGEIGKDINAVAGQMIMRMDDGGCDR